MLFRDSNGAGPVPLRGERVHQPQGEGGTQGVESERPTPSGRARRGLVGGLGDPDGRRSRLHRATIAFRIGPLRELGALGEMEAVEEGAAVGSQRVRPSLLGDGGVEGDDVGLALRGVEPEAPRPFDEVGAELGAHGVEQLREVPARAVRVALGPEQRDELVARESGGSRRGERGKDRDAPRSLRDHTAVGFEVRRAEQPDSEHVNRSCGVRGTWRSRESNGR
jgi:hypothetical protein